MDAKNFLRIKRQPQLASQPVVQPLSNPELEAQSQIQKKSVGIPTQPQDAVDRTRPSSEPELELPSESRGYVESLATTHPEESLSGSGWGYSQLLKEFRNDLKSD